MLIATAEDRRCVDCNISELDERIDRIAGKVELLTESLNETIKHNKLQDAEVSRSLRQRKVHDIALFAIVDALKQQGHNGYVTEAHKALEDYLREEAHSPIKERK